MRRCRPFVLVIVDGLGHNDSHFGNAIAAAKTPFLDHAFATLPHTVVAASGEAVGLPDGQQGNSEVGHLTIGAGRVIYQPLTRIHRAIEDGSFFDNDVLCRAIDHATERGTALHVVGLVSPGGVHSHQDHALAVCELAKRRGLDRVWVHAITDGRDEPPRSAAGFMDRFDRELRHSSSGRIASLSGRYYTMDRDKRWDRTRLAYETLVGDGAAVAHDPLAYIYDQYAEDVSDEFLKPVSIVHAGGTPVRIRDGDSVICFNFRPDRMRQIVHALVDEEFTGFERSVVARDLHVATFTEYERDLPVEVAFPREDVRDTLAEVVSRHGLRQFHIAETEKYAHVTYFVNGGREEPFPGEDRKLVPSPKVATYDTVPAMSARDVTADVLARLKGGEPELIVVNFANPDMVGHTGDFGATVAAVEVVDHCLREVVEAAEAQGGGVLITADHGNAEHKIDPRDNSPLTAHTTSPVPVLLCGTGVTVLHDGGGLRDVAPTVLELMGFDRPEAMTGRSLVKI